MKPHHELYLASQSPRRSELLSRLCVRFKTLSMDIDETRLPNETPHAMVERLAQSKAKACLQHLQQKQNLPIWVLAGDTCVAQNEVVFDKPTSHEEAIATLTALSGSTHRVYSGVCLGHATQQWTKVVVSEVTFDRLSNQEIEQYCRSDEPYDKAGGYGIQGLAATFITHISGDYSAIMGLPLRPTYLLLKQAELLPDG